MKFMKQLILQNILKPILMEFFFFSPSAVSSYFTKNTWPENAHGFCIGSSTSKTLSQFTSNFSKAKNPTENQLLHTIHKYYVEK